MRMSALIAVAGLAFANAQWGLAASGGGSFEPTVKPSTDAALEADFAQGEYLVKAEQYAQAIPFFERVIAKNPNHADALNYLGYVHRKLGKTTEAMAYYQRALAVDPKHKGTLEYLGELYLMLKDLPKAKEQLAKLKALCPQSCTQLEDLEDAIAAYQKANP